jgi:hypothetical protein
MGSLTLYYCNLCESSFFETSFVRKARARGLESTPLSPKIKDKKKCLSDTTDISYIRSNACGSRLSRISCVSAVCSNAKISGNVLGSGAAFRGAAARLSDGLSEEAAGPYMAISTLP